MGKLRDGLSTFRRRSLGRSAKSSYNQPHSVPSLDAISRYEHENVDAMLVSRKPMPELFVAERNPSPTASPNRDLSERLPASPPSTGDTRRHETRRKAAKLSKGEPAGMTPQQNSSTRPDSNGSYQGDLPPPASCEYKAGGATAGQDILDNTSNDSLQPIDDLPSPGARIPRQPRAQNASLLVERSTRRRDPQTLSQSSQSLSQTSPKSSEADGTPPRRKPLSPVAQPLRLMPNGGHGKGSQHSSATAPWTVENKGHPLPPLPPSLQGNNNSLPVSRKSSDTQRPLSWNSAASRWGSMAENVGISPLPQSSDAQFRCRSLNKAEGLVPVQSSSQAPQLPLNLSTMTSASLDIPAPFITAGASKSKPASTLGPENRSPYHSQASQLEQGAISNTASPSTRAWQLPDSSAAAIMAPPHIRDLRASSAPLPEQESSSLSKSHYHRSPPPPLPLPASSTRSYPSRPCNHYQRKSSSGSSIRSLTSQHQGPPQPVNRNAPERPNSGSDPIQTHSTTPSGQTGQSLAHAHAAAVAALANGQSSDPSRPTSLCITAPAPALTDIHFSCYHSHRRMMLSRNLYAPVACMTCGKEDDLPRFKCTWCCLRICRGCLQALEKCPGRSLTTFMRNGGSRGFGRGNKHRHTISAGSTAGGASPGSLVIGLGGNDVRRSSIAETPGETRRRSIGSTLKPLTPPKGAVHSASNSRRNSLIGSTSASSFGAGIGPTMTASSISLGPPPSLRK